MFAGCVQPAGSEGRRLEGASQGDRGCPLGTVIDRPMWHTGGTVDLGPGTPTRIHRGSRRSLEISSRSAASSDLIRASSPSVALGFVGLAMMGLQFALIARFKPVAAPFGIDALTKFHKQVSYVALTFILAHPILLFIQNGPKYLPLLNVFTAPWRARFAIAATLLLLALIGLSAGRKRLRLSYAKRGSGRTAFSQSPLCSWRSPTSKGSATTRPARPSAPCSTRWQESWSLCCSGSGS
jgi:hypothetical protein